MLDWLAKRSPSMQQLQVQVEMQSHMLANPLRCARCAHAIGIREPERAFFSEGECGRCGENVNVFDPDLAELLEGAGLDADVPFMRSSRLSVHGTGCFTMRDAGERLREALSDPDKPLPSNDGVLPNDVAAMIAKICASILRGFSHIRVLSELPENSGLTEQAKVNLLQRISFTHLSGEAICKAVTDYLYGKGSLLALKHAASHFARSAEDLVVEIESASQISRPIHELSRILAATGEMHAHALRLVILIGQHHAQKTLEESSYQ